MRHCLLVLAAAFGMLGLVAPGSSQAAGRQVPGVLVAQYNPYHQQQQQGLLLSQLGVLLAMTGAAIAIFAARARKKKQEQEEAEQRQRDAQRRRAEEGERRGNS
jgi:type VI protein secretion system component VasK